MSAITTSGTYISATGSRAGTTVELKARLKRLIAILASLRPASASGARVLLYHSITREERSDAGEMTTAIGLFRRHLAILRDDGYSVQSADRVIDAIAARRSLPSRTVAITFDDGYVGVIEHALPVLLERRLTATAFVLPGLWGKTASWPSNAPPTERRLWSESDTREWQRAGMSVGSHSMTHRDLRSLDEAAIREEIGGSRRILEGLLGRISGFCYPWSRVTSREATAAREAGYDYAVAGSYGRYHKPGDRFVLERMTIDHDDDLRDFGSKLRGGYDWLRLLNR